MACGDHELVGSVEVCVLVGCPLASCLNLLAAPSELPEDVGADQRGKLLARASYVSLRVAQPALDGGAASVEQGVTSQLEVVGIVNLGCTQQSAPAVGLVDVNGWLRVLKRDERPTARGLVLVCVQVDNGDPEVQPPHVVDDNAGVLHSHKKRGGPRLVRFSKVLKPKTAAFSFPPSGYFP